MEGGGEVRETRLKGESWRNQEESVQLGGTRGGSEVWESQGKGTSIVFFVG